MSPECETRIIFLYFQGFGVRADGRADGRTVRYRGEYTRGRSSFFRGAFWRRYAVIDNPAFAFLARTTASYRFQLGALRDIPLRARLRRNT